MLTDANYLQRVFDQALPYDSYLTTGTDEQQERWQQMHQAVSLTDAQKTLLASFVREMKVLVISGIWCGDCVEQCPLLDHLAAANDKIDLRFIDRDEAGDIVQQVTFCAGTRVPVAIFMAEDHAFCGLYGDRTLPRYRRLAQKQLGAACSTGLFIPDEEEIAGTIADWLNEFERIQLMLRLSTRLRDKYQD